MSLPHLEQLLYNNGPPKDDKQCRLRITSLLNESKIDKVHYGILNAGLDSLICINAIKLTKLQGHAVTVCSFSGCDSFMKDSQWPKQRQQQQKQHQYINNHPIGSRDQSVV